MAQRLWPGARPSTRPGDNVRIIEVNLSRGSLGTVDQTIFVHTNIKGYDKIRVPVTGQVVPPVTAAPSLLAFGELAADDHAERTLLLKSATSEPFRVIAVTPKVAGFDWTADPSDDATRVRLRFTATGRAARGLSGANAVVKIESAGRSFDLGIPVFAAQKPKP